MLNEIQIGDVWLLFSDHIDKKHLEDAAEKYIELLVDNGVNDRTLQHSTGIDPILDQAIQYYLEDNSDQEESDL